jgi:hypothetical protein
MNSTSILYMRNLNNVNCIIIYSHPTKLSFTLQYHLCWDMLSKSHKSSCYVYTRSACMPMPWMWRKCRFMFPIRLRTREQIWHVVSPMCMAICNWQDFLWRNSLLQTPQRNVGLAATDDTLLHQLPITGGNNHTLVAQINNYPFCPTNTSQSAYHVLHIKMMKRKDI